jgi:hypothetical protein
VEEQVAGPATAAGTADGSGAAPGATLEGQAFFAGTTEVRLGDGSSLSFAGLQDFGPGQVAFQHRSAVLGKASTVRWALAARRQVVRSRRQRPRATARRGQVEIVFAHRTNCSI